MVKCEFLKHRSLAWHFCWIPIFKSHHWMLINRSGLASSFIENTQQGYKRWPLERRKWKPRIRKGPAWGEWTLEIEERWPNKTGKINQSAQRTDARTMSRRSRASPMSRCHRLLCDGGKTHDMMKNRAKENEEKKHKQIQIHNMWITNIHTKEKMISMNYPLLKHRFSI